MHQNSILGTCVKVMGRALDAAGCNGPALLAQAGFDSKDLDGPDARAPLRKTGRLWKYALAATGDPAFGVKLAQHYTYTTFHSLGYGMSASSTLKEAFERAQRYFRVVSDAVVFRFTRDADEYCFILEPTTEVPAESIDALVGIFLRMCRLLAGRDCAPLSIELCRPQPAVIHEFERSWRAPIQFGAARNCLSFAREIVERRLDSGNPELAQVSDVISARYLARLERFNIEAQVRELLTERLSHNEPTQGDIARRLNMSARTLQRKLSDSGTTFKEILDETRHDLALAYLSASEFNVGEITQRLGFSSSSSFTRAFRRWTGLSPSDWRSISASRC